MSQTEPEPDDATPAPAGQEEPGQQAGEHRPAAPEQGTGQDDQGSGRGGVAEEIEAVEPGASTGETGGFASPERTIWP